MKTLVFFLVLAVVAVHVYSESCTGTDTSGCTITQCDSVTHPACVQGICTCELTVDHTCSSKAECVAYTDWNCNREKHCVDGKCHCGRI